MNWPPKLVSILSLIQIFFVVSGYFITRSFLKIYDRVAPAMYGTQAYPRSDMAEFIRSWGPWFVLIPIGWCILASARSRWENGESSLSSTQFVCGMVLTLALAWVFFIGTLNAVRFTFAGG